MVQSEQSGFGPISYFSMAALISLRRRSQLADAESRPSSNGPLEKDTNGFGKGRTIGSCAKLGKSGAGKRAPVFSTLKTNGGAWWRQPARASQSSPLAAAEPVSTTAQSAAPSQ